MQIVKAEIIVLQIPMKQGLQVSFGEIKNLKPTIIKLTDELGNIGYGESIHLPFPMTHFEYFETGLQTLKKYIIPCILQKELIYNDKDVFQVIEDFIKLYSNIKNYEMTKAGVENAFVDIITKRKKVSIHSLLKNSKTTVPAEYCFGIPHKSKRVEYIKNIQEQVQNGYDSIKLKISEGNDIELIDLVRENFPHLTISVDANQDYTLDSFKKILPIIEKNNITMVEQPLKYDDYIGNIEIKKIMNTRLCIDESISRIDQLKSLIQYKGVDIVNIKIGRVGGVYSAYKINKYCEKNNIPTWVGGLLETDIGKSINLAIAAMKNSSYANDLSTWDEFYVDHISKNPHKIEKGTITIDKSKNGLGFEVDEEKIKKYCIERYIF